MLELIFYRLVTTMEVKRVKTINVNGQDSLSFLPQKNIEFLRRRMQIGFFFLAKFLGTREGPDTDQKNCYQEIWPTVIII